MNGALRLLATAAVGLAGCTGTTLNSSGSEDPVDVIYQLGGTAQSADITYAGTGGSTEQANGIDVAIRYKTTGVEGLRLTMSRGDFVYISAQNKGKGTITCSITADGVTVDTATSQGEYAIASCSGSVP